MAALKQSNRVSSISLTITDSLLPKFVTIEGPFPELEELDLLSQDNVELTLPSIFQWGPRLRSLHLTRIAIPMLPQLSSSTNLVDLHLYEIPSAGIISPEAFANALSGMTKLRSLSFHFLSLPRDLLASPPSPGVRIVLPTLTCLKYRGISEYLDSFVARIDAPYLADIDITFDQSTMMDALQLSQFIDRIEMQRSPRQADIVSSQSAISIRFTHPGATTRLGLRVPCTEFDWQLFSMAQILNQFSHFLFRVENLGINTTEAPSGQVNVGSEEWLDLIHAFGGATEFRVASELATDILRALPADGEYPTVLPTLRSLRLRGPLSMFGPLWDAVHSLTISRWLCGHPVQVYATEYKCHECACSFKEQIGLKIHLKGAHAYRIVCSYCDDFDWSLGRSRRFTEHLEGQHPEIAHIYDHTPSQYLQGGSHGSQSIHLRAHPDHFESSTMVKPDLLSNRSTWRNRQRDATPSPPPIPLPSA
ncbi:hypothetical protein BJY52DRAFT_1311880 [Lactarius psammicola]|nr:hypothetical protein BJY52DRAFT_1311880 [Lactarius psammicola]